MNVLKTLSKSFSKPFIDPDRVAKTFREFDEDRGFRRYHAICQERCSRRPFPAVRSTLETQGFEHLTVVPRETADALMRRLIALPVVSVKKNNSRLRGPKINPALRRTLLDAILCEAIDAKLASFFQSEYLVHWLMCSVTPPDPQAATVSFKWHCDKGPSHHLKLILYLNDTSAHGGNTEFVSKKDTARIGTRGYVFGSTRNRTDDIHRLSSLADGPLSVHKQDMVAGDGVIFQPAKVLHRGVTPALGPRHAVTLCLLPSPLPWQEAFERGVTADLATEDKWPLHADELLQAMGQ